MKYLISAILLISCGSAKKMQPHYGTGVFYRIPHKTHVVVTDDSTINLEKI